MVPRPFSPPPREGSGSDTMYVHVRMCVGVRVCDNYGFCKQFLAYLLIYLATTLSLILSLHFNPHLTTQPQMYTKHTHPITSLPLTRRLKSLDRRIRLMEGLFREFRAWTYTVGELRRAQSTGQGKQRESNSCMRPKWVHWEWMAEVGCD